MAEKTERQAIMLTPQQKDTLSKLKSKGFNVSQFIRTAISEKLKRDHKLIVPDQIVLSREPKMKITKLMEIK